MKAATGTANQTTRKKNNLQRVVICSVTSVPFSIQTNKGKIQQVKKMQM
jgi:hypothetical protein